jgi:hypothetical protein
MGHATPMTGPCLVSPGCPNFNNSGAPSGAVFALPVKILGDSNMAYQLNTSNVLLDPESLPVDCAYDHVLAPPVISNLNYAGSGRASTPLYGTSPYMAGKGAPGSLIMVEDMLRPQSTTFFKKGYQGRGYDFPSQDMACSVPLRARSWDPTSSRANVQNAVFDRRYPA